MTRLTSYLTRLFAADALALFGVAAFLLFLVQCLRSFDVISVKGQDLLTLVGQVLLTMPTISITFLHVCIGIGLARALRSLQMSQELHIIHSSRRTSALFGAIAACAIGGALLVLLLTNVVEPGTRRVFNAWSASVAADLVGRTLTPHRFVEVTPGVTLVIGSRGGNGQLGNFFADDNRSPTLRRTYQAESASVAVDAQGYVLRLNNGSIQYVTDDLKFSEISFDRYDLAVEGLTTTGGGATGLDTVNSIDLILTRGFNAAVIGQLGGRIGEAFRVLSICLLVAALTAFPHGRRGGREVPVEIVVLAAAFLERLVSNTIASPFALLPVSGSLLMGLGALVVLGFKLRSRRPRAPVQVSA